MKFNLLSALISLKFSLFFFVSATSQELIHYWNFNDNLSVGTMLTPSTTIGGAEIVHLVGSSSSEIEIGTGQNFNTDNLNARNGDAAGSHLRFNNPIGGSLLFKLPMSGYEAPIVRFATRRSGQGAGEQHWYYSTDNGDNYTLFQVITTQNANPVLATLDFSATPAVNNNPDFLLRVDFVQGDGGIEGNNRFDNFTLDAVQIGQAPEILVSVSSLNFFTQTLGYPSLPQSFNVSGSGLVDDITLTVPGNFELSLEEGANFTSTLVLTNNHGLVSSTPIYVRLNSSSIGLSSGAIGISSEDANTQAVMLEGETIEQLYSLLYYWHFNTLDTEDGDVTDIDADFSFLTDFTGKMVYTNPQIGQRDIDTYSPGSAQNYHLGELPGSAARVRNPSAERSLVFDVPTTGAEDLVFTYSVQRSANGMLTNSFEYSTDGVSFTSEGVSVSTVNLENAESWYLISFDLSEIEAANDNPNFKIRMTWTDENAQNSSGNNRYDNFTLVGQPIDNTSGKIDSEQASISIYPNPTADVITVKSPTKIQAIFVFNSAGAQVLELPVEHLYETTLPMHNLGSGSYLILVQTTLGYSQQNVLKN